MAEQTIRVSAKAEFTQLQRGLKALQGDLRNVVGEINKGARKGGIFDDANLRALDVFRQRLVSSFGEARKQIDQQAEALDRLVSAMNKASGAQKDAIRKEIKERGDLLDKMDAEYRAIEKIYNMRRKEADEYQHGVRQASTPSGSGRRSTSEDSGDDEEDGGGGRRAGGMGLAGSLLGAGKLMLGLAGIGGLLSEVTKAYGLAHAREVDSLNLSQRMRGSNGWGGTNLDQFRKSADIGMADNMGYSQGESWQFLDQYTRQAGGMNADQMGASLKFGRAYGLTAGESAGALGGNRALGGTNSPKELADAIAGSVGTSGMTPRILEVMETNNTLLSQMNTSLKDGSAKQILAYQTTLDTIGMKNGMMQLTGSQGANLIGGMGGIYKPESNWQWMGIRALQGYNPDKYGKMDMFDLQSSFEDGLMNKDNIPAMGKYIKGISGGDEKLQKRMMQRWLTDGGFAATKREASEFYDATNGLSVFDDKAMSKLQGGAIDSGAKYTAERENLRGQNILSTDARYEKALSDIGDPIVDAVLTVKTGVTAGLEAIAGDVLDLKKFLEDNLKLGNPDLASMVSNLPKLLSTISAKVFGGNPLEFLFGNPTQNAYKEMYKSEAPDWLKSQDQLDVSSPTFFRDDPRWKGDKPVFSDPNISAEEKIKQKALYEQFTMDEAKSSLTTPIAPTDDDERRRQKLYSQPQSLGNGAGNVIGDALEWLFKGIFFGGGAGAHTASAKEIKDFSVKGVSFFENMDTTTEKKMGAIYDEHKGFKNQMAGYFAPVADFFMHFGSGMANQGGSNGGLQMASFGSSVLGSSTSASKLNEKLGGVLSGYGQAFDFAGKKYGIDPAFLASVAMHETGNGTSDAAKNKHNIGGMMGSNGLMSFGSTLEGLDAMASNLKRNYIDQGLVTIDQIQKKYAPVGADNDPTGLNNNWTKGVSSYMQQLGGSGTGAVNDELAGSLIGSGGAKTASTKTESTVNVNLTGDAANKLNSLTKNQLISLITQIMKETNRTQLSLTPTKGA